MWLRGDGFKRPVKGGVSPSSRGPRRRHCGSSGGGPVTYCICQSFPVSLCLSSPVSQCASQQARGPAVPLGLFLWEEPCPHRSCPVARTPASGAWQAVPLSLCPLPGLRLL